jgi:hypothetical protein
MRKAVVWEYLHGIFTSPTLDRPAGSTHPELAMKNEAMNNLLKQLHGTLNSATSITEKDRELLEQLSTDIEALLAPGSSVTRARHQSVIDRLVAAVTRFEVSHPDLTATMTQVSNKLSDMGI